MGISSLSETSTSLYINLERIVRDHLFIDEFNSEEPASVNSSLPKVPSFGAIWNLITASCGFRLLSLALSILQRSFSHIPPQVFAYLSNFSPHRLFTGAYIVIAKKKNTNTLPIQVIQNDSRLTGDIPSIMMDDFRARFTDYPSPAFMK